MRSHIVITGSEGNIGRRLRKVFPDVVGIDRVPGAEIQVDLGEADYGAPELVAALASAAGVIHLGTSPHPDGPPEDHLAAVINSARLVQACAAADVPKLVLASSGWAAPESIGQELNAYGQSKRALEALAGIYSEMPGRRAVALRIGWVPRDVSQVAQADEWLQRGYWDDDTVAARFKAALDGMAGDGS